jgi:hypothetical protein
MRWFADGAWVALSWLLLLLWWWLWGGAFESFEWGGEVLGFF